MDALAQLEMVAQAAQARKAASRLPESRRASLHTVPFTDQESISFNDQDYTVPVPCNGKWHLFRIAIWHSVPDERAWFV
jgi:hypothetical protein